MDNVVFTPHNAFNSQEALIRILDTSVGNIEGFLESNGKNLVG
jgi:D-lactate dehydrogenase